MLIGQLKDLWYMEEEDLENLTITGCKMQVRYRKTANIHVSVDGWQNQVKILNVARGDYY